MLKGRAPQKHLVINRRLFSLLFRRLFFPFSVSPAIGAPSLFFLPLLLLLCAADPCAVCASLICMWCWMPRKERGGKKNKPSKELSAAVARGNTSPRRLQSQKLAMKGPVRSLKLFRLSHWGLPLLHPKSSRYQSVLKLGVGQCFSTS